MRREKHTVWIEDDTGAMLLRRQTDADYHVLPAYCTAGKLAELGKAIIDALVSTEAGDDLLSFAVGKLADVKTKTSRDHT